MMARRLILKGRVQGVGFRYFTYETAQDLGIKGWVRNLANGDVEVHAEGEQEAMEQFVSRIQSGPSLAIVEDMEVQKMQSERHADFSIKT